MAAGLADSNSTGFITNGDKTSILDRHFFLNITTVIDNIIIKKGCSCIEHSQLSYRMHFWLCSKTSEIEREITGSSRSSPSVSFYAK